MHFEHGLDSKPPLLRSLVMGLQWAVIASSLVIILGKVAAGVHLSPGQEIVYLQKLFAVTAVAVLVQVFWGHRLPVLSGPATAILVGVLSGQGAGAPAVYTAVGVGGVLLSALSLTGLFSTVQRFFTRRVVAVVLLLIAFTLTPTIQRLLIDAGGGVAPVANLVFALGLLVAMFLFHWRARGFWKSTLIVWAMLAGSLAYVALLGRVAPPATAAGHPLLGGFFVGLTARPSLDPGVLLSFFFCYLALAVNDIAAIQAMGPLLNPGAMERRVTRGMALTGLANAVAGLFGVIGVVNFSLSAGVVVSTACASQFTLVPAGLLMLLLSLSPAAIQLLGSVPPVVIGCVLLYVLTSQFASGLFLAFPQDAEGGFELEDGVVIGLPVILGTVVAFLPAEVVAGFPAALRPTLGNGFVVGVAGALLLEHLLSPGWLRARPSAPGG
jgi:xanthine/uracil permease